jgi:phospholipid/cholesterol/gamma-HCH transport system permease protein
MPILKAAGYLGDTAANKFGRVRQAIAFAGSAGEAVWDALSHPRRARWREVIYVMDNCGTRAVPIVFLICLLVGVVLAYNAGLQLMKLGSEVYLCDSIGVAMVKEFGPLMVAIIATGRSGSAFAAEIGTMKGNDELDALTTFGLEPHRFLSAPKILGMIVVQPVLTLIGSAAGLLGGYLIASLMCKIPVAVYCQRVGDAVTMAHLCEGLVKSMAFAVAIAIIGCLRGAQASGDALGVGRGTTSAMVTGLFWVIILDTLCNFLANVLY